jgi:hypothetical protein
MNRTTMRSLTQAELNEDLNATPMWTGNSSRVTPFLEAVANDMRHGTYHAACADQFEEMAEAVKNYFEELVMVEGADMPGLAELDEALEYVANGRHADFPDVGKSMTPAEAVEGEGNIVLLRPAD